MLPAGDVTDAMIHQFMELADEGDIIVDGANSYFRDSVARAREVRNAGLRWLDAGVSGGVWGYDVGYCTMIGGDADAFEYVEPAFETLAPRRATLISGTLAQDTSPRWSTTGSSTGCSRPTPKGSRSSRSPATTTTSGPLQPVEPGERRPQLAPGARRERLREGRQPRRHQRLRRGLGRGTLDGARSDRRGRTGERHSRLPIRPLRLPPGRLRHEGHSRPARRVRRARDKRSRHRAREIARRWQIRRFCRIFCAMSKDFRAYQSPGNGDLRRFRGPYLSQAGSSSL